MFRELNEEVANFSWHDLTWLLICLWLVIVLAILALIFGHFNRRKRGQPIFSTFFFLFFSFLFCFKPFSFPFFSLSLSFGYPHFPVLLIFSFSLLLFGFVLNLLLGFLLGNILRLILQPLPLLFISIHIAAGWGCCWGGLLLTIFVLLRAFRRGGSILYWGRRRLSRRRLIHVSAMCGCLCFLLYC